MGKLKNENRRILLRTSFSKRNGFIQATIEANKKYEISNDLKQKFYSSKEWLKLKEWAFLRFKKECFCCHSVNNIELDHIKPISRSPSLCLDFKNVQFLCRECNSIKSNRTKKIFKKLYVKTKNDSFMPSDEDIRSLKSKFYLFFPIKQ